LADKHWAAAVAEKPHRRLGRAVRLLAAVSTLILLFSAAPTTVAFLQTPDQASPEGGSAQVVAQGVVEIPEGDVVWRVMRASAPPPINARPAQSGLGFLVVQTGVLLAQDETTGEQQRLPAGEAMLTRPGVSHLRAALGADAADYIELTLQASGTEPPSEAALVFSSDPFPGTGGRHDLDLLQGAMAPGEALSLPSGSLPTLLYSARGAVDVTIESGEVVPLASGQAISLVGPLTITAGGDGADLSIAFTGPAVPLLTVSSATPMAVGRVIEGAAVAATPAAGTLPAATATVEQGTTAEDTDGDGLSNADEAELNTDPELVDTDEDGLSDGDEVHQFKTSPLAPDTDGDGVLDGDEVAQSSDPLSGIAVEAAPDETPVAEEPAVESAPEPSSPEVPAAVAGDSDGDGLPDEVEASLGTDPFDTDTDDDGLSDGDEYYVHQTGTRNPDTDGDGVVDGDEVTNGTNPNDPASA
jgi:hypothetical protein